MNCGNKVVEKTIVADADTIALIEALLDGLGRAELLHPVFAEGVWEGIGRVSEEHGELAQAVSHNEPDERIRAEAMDLLVVAFRFARRDWEMEEDKA